MIKKKGVLKTTKGQNSHPKKIISHKIPAEEDLFALTPGDLDLRAIASRRLQYTVF
jgi:hypothetical protein